VNRFPEGAGIPRLFHSERSIALIIDKTIRGGFGYLRAGTVLAKVADGMCVPYVPAVVAATEVSAIGTSYVLGVSGGKIRVPVGDGAKFAAGDTIQKHGDEYETEIVIDAITHGAYYDELTTDEHAAVTAGDFVRLKGADTAVYVLDHDTDSGFGEGAKGSNVPVVVSNATLYKNSVFNLDSDAITGLGGIIDGQFFILK
jgi:hypothetical protein